VGVGWLAVIEDGVRDAVSGRVTVRRSDGVAVPEGLPDLVPVYPAETETLGFEQLMLWVKTALRLGL